MKQNIKLKNSFKINNLVFKLLLSSSIFMLDHAYAQTNDLSTQEASQEDAATVTPAPIPLKQINAFADIFERIKESYVEPVSDEQLLDYAIKGMLSGLDPHSVYLKQERYTELNEGTSGKFGGLGIEVVWENGLVTIIAPIDDTPAAEAGLQSGDLIIGIDGDALTGNDLRSATEKMRGEPGTPISLTIVREGKTEPFDVELIRAIIRVSSVKRQRLSDRIGYLRITQFQSQTSESFRKQLKMLREIKDFSGLILDLRNNPGGLLNSAISISDAFLTEGTIVSTKGRRPDNNSVHKATSIDLLDGKPIIVLINAGSASASEIVAGALQDHKRALILGTSSFGKGSVQTVINLGAGDGIKLTTARYFTPNGTSIQASGIVPDVTVEQRDFKDIKKTFDRIKENDLEGHLESSDEPNKESEISEKVAKMLAKDYQLNEAFNLLNGLILFTKN